MRLIEMRLRGTRTVRCVFNTGGEKDHTILALYPAKRPVDKKPMPPLWNSEPGQSNLGMDTGRFIASALKKNRKIADLIFAHTERVYTFLPSGTTYFEERNS